MIIKLKINKTHLFLSSIVLALLSLFLISSKITSTPNMRSDMLDMGIIPQNRQSLNIGSISLDVKA